MYSSESYLILCSTLHDGHGHVLKVCLHVLFGLDLPHLLVDHLVQHLVLEGVEVEVKGDDAESHAHGHGDSQDVVESEDALGGVLRYTEPEGLCPEINCDQSSNLGMLLHLGGEILKATLIRDREALEKYREALNFVRQVR